ncbi:hypothetical protein JXQ70_17015 [bacterium]|nr:hypothetical protein [bacterium]
MAHLLGSTVAAVALGSALDSVEAGVTCFLTGVLIDLDHVLDYVQRRRKRKLGFRDFFRTDEWAPQGRLFLIFHAWEYLPLLLVLTFVPGLSEIGLGALCGIGLHLIMDHLNNRGFPYTYFILFRWFHGFKSNCFFRMPSRRELPRTSAPGGTEIRAETELAGSIAGQTREP